MNGYTALFEGKIFQSTPAARRVLQAYRVGLSADEVAAISSVIRVFQPGDEVALGAVTRFIHIYCTATLRATLTTVNPTTLASQTLVLDVNRLLTLCSSCSNLVVSNASQTPIEARIVYC